MVLFVCMCRKKEQRGVLGSSFSPTPPPPAVSFAPLNQTYSAYCITPFLGSWLVSGKSLGSTLVEPAPAWGWTWAALLVDEEEIEAAAIRKGTSDVVGLAVGRVLSCQYPAPFATLHMENMKASRP